jgi:hypothetical protein
MKSCLAGPRFPVYTVKFDFTVWSGVEDTVGVRLSLSRVSDEKSDFLVVSHILCVSICAHWSYLKFSYKVESSGELRCLIVPPLVLSQNMLTCIAMSPLALDTLPDALYVRSEKEHIYIVVSCVCEPGRRSHTESGVSVDSGLWRST